MTFTFNTVIQNLKFTIHDLSANTIDGSFYGPNGEEVGGTFRLSNGVPDNRVDILGVFTGR